MVERKFEDRFAQRVAIREKCQAKRKRGRIGGLSGIVVGGALTTLGFINSIGYSNPHAKKEPVIAYEEMKQDIREIDYLENTLDQRLNSIPENTRERMRGIYARVTSQLEGLSESLVRETNDLEKGNASIQAYHAWENNEGKDSTYLFALGLLIAGGSIALTIFNENRLERKAGDLLGYDDSYFQRSSHTPA